MSRLQFPISNFNTAENFVIFQAHEPTSSTATSSQENSGGVVTRDSFGEKVGPEILLHAPNAIQESNSHRYKVVNARLINAVASVGEGNLGDIAGGLSTLMDELLPDSVGVAKGILSQSTQNPVEEQFYQAPNFRTHQFSYELAASSAAETEAIHAIIDSFRRNSYPKLQGGFGTEGTTRYQFPSNYKIQFARGSQTGKIVGLGSPTKCVLTAINVNYTGAGIPVTHKDGKSSFVNLDMTFTETNLLNADHAGLN